MTSPPSFPSYQEFWPFYLREHSQVRTRTFHLVGTSLAILALVAAIVTLDPAWLVVAVLCGYGFAWYAHMFVQKIRPATFSHPLWSLRADFHMFWLHLTSRLDAELAAHNIK